MNEEQQLQNALDASATWRARLDFDPSAGANVAIAERAVEIALVQAAIAELQSSGANPAELAALLASPEATEPVELPPEPDQSALDLQWFEARRLAHDRLSSEFGAWNLARVRSGEFSPLEIDDWLDSPPITKILAQLRRYSFEMAVASIQALPVEGPTTEEFKSVWIPKLQAAF